ncbi:nitroreductase family protein [Longispora sp. NPDC051575]|uniref:nitroreductase family protein n=1 Tax=Longispora sp. NPDC051575 TaxID=3154943 RepID=UPI00342383E6
MEFAEVIRRRRMVRHFSDRPLTPEVIERILASALRAPSAGFVQGWAFLALTEQSDRDRFWAFTPNQTPHFPTLRDAPLVVVPLANRDAYVEHYAKPDRGGLIETGWPAPYWFIDAGMAALLMLLTSVDEGLGACFLWLVPPVAEFGTEGSTEAHLDAFRAEFGVPAEYTPVVGIAIGYRASDLPPQAPVYSERRRGVDDVFHRGQWGGR